MQLYSASTQNLWVCARSDESMAIVKTNWAQFLEPNSELPTDVVFKVVERSEEDVGEVWTGKVVFFHP